MSKISAISLADESLIELVKAMTNDQKELAVQFLDTKLLRAELAFREEDLTNRFDELYTVLDEFSGKEHTIENLEKFFKDIANVLSGKKKVEEKTVVEELVDKVESLPLQINIDEDEHIGDTE